MEMTMGMRIKECRVKMGMTQEKLAEQICCKKSLISQYENDKVDLKGSVIVELAKILGTTTGYLLNGEIGCNLDEDEMEMLELFSNLKNCQLREVSIKQLRILKSIHLE